MAAIHAWDGADWTTGDVTGIATWDGSAWQAVTSANYWDGSAWVKFWPEDAPTPTFVGAEMAFGLSTSLAIDVPAGVQDDDEMLSLLVNAAASAATDPAGWTALDAASSVPTQGASSRRTASSEPSSYTWTGLQSGQAARGVNLAYRNVGATYDSSLAVASNSSPSAPSVNVIGASDIVVAVGLGSGATTPNTPTGFTSVFSAAGVRISVATPGTGATGSVAMSGFGAGWNLAALFAMSPS